MEKVYIRSVSTGYATLYEVRELAGKLLFTFNRESDAREYCRFHRLKIVAV